jgi:excisionase family DNA binding protein
MSEPEREYLTVPQAAARLGLSERTLRKRIKAGEIEAEKRPIIGGGVAWQVLLSPERAGSEPEAERKPFESESRAERKRAGSGTENAPEVSVPRAGSEPEANLVAHLKEENAFLRAQIDAWRLQAEAANRTASETSAALREALKAMPKGLPSGSTPNAEKTSREDAPQAPQSATGEEIPTASTPVAQRGAKRRELTGWQRIGARILGIR